VSNSPAGTRASCESLTADKGYDCNWLRKIRDLGVRPLIKHCINKPYDHAHNARIDDDLYGQRSMAKPSTRRSSARWASPCERGHNTENFVKSL